MHRPGPSAQRADSHLSLKQAAIIPGPLPGKKQPPHSKQHTGAFCEIYTNKHQALGTGAVMTVMLVAA